ncbi:3-hydroxyacyl-[acyl-carrier-protein] dehydratase [Singulisphaera sp. GP187]|uniref:3-hydroxyacyl-ACP dehydratase FabZ family protein n=1 Tax=Singulisphaera sp. GP187 TaxID=1882752 RepID=UPI000928DF48|nr:3-hydroxyacyl-ACP dehydratase FabZ family protein [Singulisphaera sp. GP187]SIN71650.1 3-hydroxyacyl-[acyl-carrier-protein] dehydratase [Singulisphaera sp. GP187]
MSPAALVDPAGIDTSKVLFDIETIRRANPQRFEMEQLTAVVSLDLEARLIVGYKDVNQDEFWVRGHLPGLPQMPGVMICEAAAQLCSFYCHSMEQLAHGFIGFGGMHDVWIQGSVRPGDRLLIVGKAERLRRRQTMFATQAFVGTEMVFHGTIVGVHLATASSPVADESHPRS